MNKIIKRLEIIKSAIELEDEEIIRQQLIYLKNRAAGCRNQRDCPGD